MSALTKDQNLDGMQVKNVIKTHGAIIAGTKAIKDLTEEAMKEVTTLGSIKEGKGQVEVIVRDDQ